MIVTVNVLTLVTLANMIQTGVILFVSYYPRKQDSTITVTTMHILAKHYQF
jgi:hypothetical protein